MFLGGYIDGRVMAQGSAVSWKTSDKIMVESSQKYEHVFEWEKRTYTILIYKVLTSQFYCFFFSRGTEERQNYWAKVTPTGFSRVRQEHFNGDKFHWSEIVTWQLSNLKWFYLSSSTSRHNFRIFHPSFIIFVFLVGFTIRFLCVPAS